MGILETDEGQLPDRLRRVLPSSPSEADSEGSSPRRECLLSSWLGLDPPAVFPAVSLCELQTLAYRKKG
jgi:hypothetical protein